LHSTKDRHTHVPSSGIFDATTAATLIIIIIIIIDNS
jgi:hypothetical protein